MRCPQTTGLECARPGIAARQRIFSPVLPSQRSGRFCRSATPAACAPRNDGQFAFVALGSGLLGGRAPLVLDLKLIWRAGMTFVSSAGDQALLLSIILRGTQSSAISSKLTCLPSIRTR